MPLHLLPLRCKAVAALLAARLLHSASQCTAFRAALLSAHCLPLPCLLLTPHTLPPAPPLQENQHAEQQQAGQWRPVPPKQQPGSNRSLGSVDSAL